MQEDILLPGETGSPPDANCVEQESVVVKNKFRIEHSEYGFHILIHNRYYQTACAKLFLQRKPRASGEISLRLNDCQDFAARCVFRQIEWSMNEGISWGKYYECKVLELLYLINRQGCSRRCASCKRRLLTEEDLRAVNTARNIIEKNLRHCPTVAELARLTSTSKGKLHQDFKTVFGQPIHEYLQTVRLRRAVNLLEQSDLPIYQIAGAVGLKKAGQFSEIFKKNFGVTPSEYRGQKHDQTVVHSGKLS